ncbi:hypothetical protein TVAG_454080 [Trichomonas vaginalis G3]|uniref:Uncharacterized protein n=1 Tax=Trichomonas vaginalis (strain ATCC PRA-98 / G3) TaxID=412133 RepID=A2DPY4_TRIV3|nr:hypothetical protein TVAGG3_0552580 [Trichomonas vaginalis G3]EAY17580.1 hypothetical protein TVAG_454080 [Trichomonas vaginalis G3]KAI5520624.1 hypothetical protein TVAGG3_0552580 [Trichomonas vaginalis G3]|eukprot:XP_001329715.1 hypothetical protein [Trichomonas vaginalis G3]
MSEADGRFSKVKNKSKFSDRNSKNPNSGHFKHNTSKTGSQNENKSSQKSNPPKKMKSVWMESSDSSSDDFVLPKKDTKPTETTDIPKNVHYSENVKNIPEVGTSEKYTPYQPENQHPDQQNSKFGDLIPPAQYNPDIYPPAQPYMPYYPPAMPISMPPQDDIPQWSEWSTDTLGPDWTIRIDEYAGETVPKPAFGKKNIF